VMWATRAVGQAISVFCLVAIKPLVVGLIADVEAPAQLADRQRLSGPGKYMSTMFPYTCQQCL
jgi:hypothetical protein